MRSYQYIAERRRHRPQDERALAMVPETPSLGMLRAPRVLRSGARDCSPKCADALKDYTMMR